MKVLVTGGAGFIGHHLVAELVRRGDDVVVLDSLITGFRRRLDDVAAAITFIEGDIRNEDSCIEAVRGIDTVYHLAALPSVQRSLFDPVLTNAINAGGTINVMEAAAAAGVRRVVLSGSSSIYGSAPVLPRREDQPPDPLSAYAVSKLAAEGYVRTIGSARGVQTVVLRYFNVFGPGQDPASEYAAVVPRFITAVLSGTNPVIFGDGQQSRDFTYVANVVDANLLAADVPEADGAIINIGCGERHTLLELLGMISLAAGVQVQPVFLPTRQGDVRDSQSDIARAVEVLGYHPVVDVTEGIRRTVTSYRAAATA